MSLFFIISKVIDFLVSPLFWIGLLLLGSLFLKRKQWARRCLIASVVLFFVFTNNFIIDLILRGWETEMVPLDQLKPTYDVGVVLGGGMVNFDKPNQRIIFRNNTDRFLQALDLHNKKKIKNILLSSGAGTILFRDVIESDLIRKFLTENHVPDSAIVVDNQSDNTHENALQTKKLIDKKQYKTVLLITSATHMPRARWCFEKVGVVVDVFPTDKLVSVWRYDPEYLLVPNVQALKRWETFIHEFIGVIVYKMMGYI